MSTHDLDQNTIDSLFTPKETAAKIVQVNFTERRSLTASQMKVLASLNQPVSMTLSAHLSSSFGSDIRVSMLAAERVLYRDQLKTVDPEGMYMTRATFDSSGASALLQIDMPCVNPLVHLGLGGRTDLPSDPGLRELTPIDNEVMEHFSATVWGELNQVWAPFGLKTTFDKRVLPTDILKIFPHSEYLLSFTYGISIGSQEGFLILSLSTSISDQLLRGLERQDVERKQPPAARRIMQERLGHIHQAAVVRFPPFSIRYEDICNLKSGTLLLTGIPKAATAQFVIPGGPVWQASLMQRDGRICAELLHRNDQNGSPPRATTVAPPGPAKSI